MFKVSFDAASMRRLTNLIKRIERAQAFGQDRTPLTTDMRNKQAKTWVQNFPKGGRYGGYEKLSQETVANRIRQGYRAGPPLIRTGLMAGFVAADSVRKGKPSNDGVFWHFTNYNFGSDVGVYPVWHNEGAGTMPARKFWDLNGEDQTMHEERAEKWLNQIGRIVLSGR